MKGIVIPKGTTGVEWERYSDDVWNDSPLRTKTTGILNLSSVISVSDGWVKISYMNKVKDYHLSSSSYEVVDLTDPLAVQAVLSRDADLPTTTDRLKTSNLRYTSDEVKRSLNEEAPE